MLLLRLRRQVPARLDGGDGRRAVARSCPTSTSRSAAATSRATSATRGRSATSRSTSFSRDDLRGARQPLHHAPLARDRLRVVVAAARSSSPSAGAAIVSNPYNGIERWFEPGSELLVVNDAEAAVAAYRDLLADPAQAEEMGRRARERVLDEHTYRHRARQLLELVGLREERMSLSSPACGGSRSFPRSTRSGTSARVIDELRAFDADARRRSSSPTARPTARPSAREAARRARDRAAVQPRASAAPCRPASATPREHGYELAVRVDGDGQHDPAELPKARRHRRVAGKRPTSASARASPAPTATGRRRRGASASACSRASSRRSPRSA